MFKNARHFSTRIARPALLAALAILGSIGFLNLDVQCAFVPGFKNNGDVLFSWLKLSFY